jgi:hypothetical protein
MSWFIRVIITIFLFNSATGYGLYKIYKTYTVFPVIFILTFLPILFFILSKKTGSLVIDIFTGHYLFYLNSFLIIMFLILILDVVLKIFSIDLLGSISLRKKEFHLYLIVVLGITGIVGSFYFKNIKIKKVELFIPKENEVKNLKIAFISDVHLNQKFDGDVLETALEKIKKVGVELLLIGGDFLDGSHKEIKKDIQKILDRYPFKKGIYMVLGNHEYYGGIIENIKYIQSLGITILKDENIVVDGITILGRDDMTNKKRKSIEELLKGVDKNKPLIVVEHNPLKIEENTKQEVDIYLAGHTHNGQLFPFNLVVKNMYQNPMGYQKISNAHTIVSSGLGTWMIPYRIGSQSEIIILDLSFKTKNKEK